MTVKETAPRYALKKKVFTYQDYVNLPADDSHYQLIRGELIMTPAPKIVHQRVKREIEHALISHVSAQRSGEVFDAPCDVYLDEHNVVQPDILFIAKENQKIITEDNIKGAPDLIIEILSPSSAYYDLVEKKELYEQFGVKEYWIVDPKKLRIEVFILKDKKFILKQRTERQGNVVSTVIKDLQINLETIFSQV
ncbi:Uma2 family endonuclease [Calditrichota bacterium LG25]